MLENITQKLGSVFDKLKGRGALSEKDVDSALGDVRKALLEADVAIEAVKTFLENTRKRAVGTEVLRSITPGQMVIKVVHDELVTLLGNDEDANFLADHYFQGKDILDLNAFMKQISEDSVLLIGQQRKS